MTFLSKLLSLTCISLFPITITAQDINDWLQEQLSLSVELRHLDYEQTYQIVSDPPKRLEKEMDPLLTSLVIIECERAFGLDSVALMFGDLILERAPKYRLEKGVALSLFFLKYKHLFFHNKFKEIEQMTDYIDQHWAEDERMRLQSAHWRRIAQAGKDVEPVKIQRSKNVVGLSHELDYMGHMFIEANLNQSKNRRLIVDTGLLSSTILFKDFANQIGVHLLPDSTHASSATHPDAAYNMQLGILDSLRIDDILILNLPVWVSDEANEYDCDGFIGTPDLARLDYVEFTRDSIIFRYPVPEPSSHSNFTMNAGAHGDRCICLPCKINGNYSSFLFDTGSGGFLLPHHYSEIKDGVFIEVGGVQMRVAPNMMSAHGFAPYEDSRGFFGTPLLYAFEKLCFNFRDCNVEYVRKKDLDFIEFY